MPLTEINTLTQSLRHDMVCQDQSARDTLLGPGYTYLPIAQALRRALDPAGEPGTSYRGDVQARRHTDPA